MVISVVGCIQVVRNICEFIGISERVYPEFRNVYFFSEQGFYGFNHKSVLVRHCPNTFYLHISLGEQYAHKNEDIEASDGKYEAQEILKAVISRVYDESTSNHPAIKEDSDMQHRLEYHAVNSKYSLNHSKPSPEYMKDGTSLLECLDLENIQRPYLLLSPSGGLMPFLIAILPTLFALIPKIEPSSLAVYHLSVHSGSMVKHSWPEESLKTS